MAAPIITPGSTADVPATGTVAPSDTSYSWEIFDVISNVRIASSASPSGWNVVLDTNTPRGANITVPAGASQGGDTSTGTTGRYEWRVSAGTVATAG